MRRLASIGLVLLLPWTVAAQTSKAPEALLPAESILFFRFDGFESHRKAYDQTVTAELMRGDLGKLVEYVGQVIKDTIGPMVLKEQLLEGIPPDQLLEVQKAANQLPTALALVAKHGLVIGLELIDVENPRVQVTIIFPNGGDDANRQALFGLIRMATSLAKLPVKESQIDGRTVFEIEKIEPGHVAWWQEGGHVVLTAGTEPVSRALEIANGKRPSLLDSALFKDVAGFKKYETIARAFIDMERGLKLAHGRGEPAQKIIKALGLESLKSVTAHFGFEGKFERSTIVLNINGPRQGILKLATAPEAFDLSHLPPLPPDAVSVSAFHLDLGTLFDVAVAGVEGVMSAVIPDELPQFRKFLEQMNKALGVDVRKDILAALDPLIVTYNSPSEGPLTLGMGLMVKVKDPKKLLDGLDKMFKSLPALGANVSVRKRTYQGQDLFTVHVPEQGFVFTPSYAIHNNWLVVGLYPQTVQGYLFRSTGKYETWKPTELAQKVIAEAKKDPKVKLASVSVSDPRPTIRQLFSIAPIIASAVNSFAPGSFDTFMLPNAQAITEPLFPNVTISVDTGDSVRLESWASLALPFELTGVDTYAIAFFFAVSIGRGF